MRQTPGHPVSVDMLDWGGGVVVEQLGTGEEAAPAGLRNSCQLGLGGCDLCPASLLPTSV